MKNSDRTRCTPFLRQIPLDFFRLKRDGRKWKQAARSRRTFLILLSSYANGDGTFIGDNGTDYSPSEKTLVAHINRSTYYIQSEDLRKLGYLSWIRRQNHYNRRTFTIHLPETPLHHPDPPAPTPPPSVPPSEQETYSQKTPPIFDEEHLSDSGKSGPIFATNQVRYSSKTGPTIGRVTGPTSSNYPSFPIVEPSSASGTEERCEASGGVSVSGATSEKGMRSVPPSNQWDGRLVDFAFGDDDSGVSSPHDESGFQPDTCAGCSPCTSRETKNPSQDVPDEPMTPATKRRIQKSYAMQAATDFYQLDSSVRECVRSIEKKCLLAWEHKGTHDEDGDPISEEDRELPSFPKPKKHHQLQIAKLLQTYSEVQIVAAWEKFLKRQQGLGGLDFVWANFLGGESTDGEFENCMLMVGIDSKRNER